MCARAAAMAPDDRREALVDATLPLLYQHGRSVTTRQIADAAGVAEGTIFRVFESKDDLIQAALLKAFDFQPFLDDLRRIQPDQGLRAVLLDISTHLQIRFRGIFGLMARMGMMQPIVSRQHTQESRDQAALIIRELLTPYSAEMVCTPAHLAHVLRLLTFSATHPHISEGQQMTPDQIVDVLLHGLANKAGA